MTDDRRQITNDRRQLVRPGYGEALRPDERSLGEDGKLEACPFGKVYPERSRTDSGQALREGE